MFAESQDVMFRRKAEIVWNDKPSITQIVGLVGLIMVKEERRRPAFL